MTNTHPNSIGDSPTSGDTLPTIRLAFPTFTTHAMNASLGKRLVPA
jgi:hypothetical protein